MHERTPAKSCRLEATACRPATPGRLRGPLKGELETLGPETITIRGGSGAYAVRVADHANTGQKGDATLADKSAAEVKVYRHTGELSRFNIRRGAGGKKGPVWEVCKILVGRDKTTVQAVNAFSDDLPK